MAEHPFDVVVRSGTIATGTRRLTADLGVRGGRVAALAPAGDLDGMGADELDARGLLILPGLIDAHVHFRQPGLEHEEDWDTGTRAAVLGGVTTVLDMPNTVPPTATVAAAREKLALAEASARCDFGIFGLLGGDAHDARALVESGLVVGLKAFLGPTTGELAAPTDDDLRAGLLAAREAKLRVVFHAEDGGIVARATHFVRSAGRSDALAHLDARPAAAEEAAIERVGALLLETGAAGHVAHLTSADGLMAVERWRAAGADLTCELTPHHALLGTDVYERYGGLAKVNPPIRGEPDASTLLAALAAGRIDLVASDHAPHVPADKRGDDIWNVAAGIPGVEALLPLMLTQVAAGRLTLEALVRVTSERPAQAFGLWPRKGSLNIGADADLVLVDPQRRGVIRAAEHHSKNPHTPFEGAPTIGAMVTTIVRGRVAVRDGVLIGEPGSGAPITHARRQSPS